MAKFKFSAITPDGCDRHGRRGRPHRHHGAPCAGRPRPGADRGRREEEHPPVRDHPGEGPAHGAHALLPPDGRLHEGRHPRPRGPRGHDRGDRQQGLPAGPGRDGRLAARRRDVRQRGRRSTPRPSLPTTSASSRSAELTGNLDTVLDQLADYIDRDIEARRKITSALIYPAIVFVLVDRRHRRHHRLRAAPVQDVLRVAARQAAPSDPHAHRDRQLLRERLVRLRRRRRLIVAAGRPRRRHPTGPSDPRPHRPAHPRPRRPHPHRRSWSASAGSCARWSAPASRSPRRCRSRATPRPTSSTSEGSTHAREAMLRGEGLAGTAGVTPSSSRPRPATCSWSARAPERWTSSSNRRPTTSTGSSTTS